MTQLEVRPAPAPDEAAAIVAAFEALWPKPAVVESDTHLPTPPWRFSGRWWVSPVPLRRARPRIR
jgi:hypothetical protein